MGQRLHKLKLYLRGWINYFGIAKYYKPLPDWDSWICSRKKYWHLSKTLATQTGMSNTGLAEQGLVSLKEIWVTLHYQKRKM